MWIDRFIRKVTNQDIIDLAKKTNGTTERAGKVLQELDKFLDCTIQPERSGDRRCGMGRRKNDW